MDALLEAAVRLAAPLLLAALGELVVERAGVVNIGIEGMMLTGAFVAIVATLATGSPLLGVVAAAAAAAALGALFAAFAVVRKVDQIVVGTAINLLALGATGLGVRALYAGNVPTTPHTPEVLVSGLGATPLLGAVLFRQPAYVAASLALALGVGLFLARTRPGLRLRAVGEHARAADAEGVGVDRVRFAAVLAGGCAAGLGGAVLSLGQAHTFSEGMTAGRGFIALAIVIFGRWRAAGIVAASLFFGAANALQFRLQARGFPVPYAAFLMLPYLLTLAVLALATGRARAPADLARPYRREAVS
jgi:simple sugar transport system permease protein